jgi:hypothetical protein
MKKFFSFLVVYFGLLYFNHAQIVNPKDLLKRKAEQRANQKIEEGVDKVLDGLFAPKKKESTNKDKPNTTDEDSENVSAPDLSGILGKFDMGGKPKSAYSFSSSMTMKMTMNNPKEKESFSMRTKYMFSDDMNSFGVRMLGSDNPDMAKATSMMDAMVMDFEQKKMFTFMNNNGQKTMMGIGFKDDALTKYVEKENDKIKVTKTSQTKTIAGYKCDAFLVENEKEKDTFTMWVSQNRVGEMAKMAAKMSQGSSPFGGAKASNKNYMAYNAHPEFVKMANEGRMMLGFSAKGEKGETTEMEFEEIKPNDKVTFDTAGYKSMF